MKVKVVHVIPIARGIGKETLSYFSAADIASGSVINVPLRSKSVPALVVGTEDMWEAKTEIKTNPYTIRKLEDQAEAKPLMLPAFMQSVKKTAAYHAGTTGSALAQLFPKMILEEAGALPPLPAEEKKKQGRTPEIFVLQTDDEERLANYKSLIREEFARGASVFCCLPTVEDIKHISALLPRGIEKYSFVLHGSLTKKELLSTWKAALLEKHPVLIMGTGSFLGIPRADLGTLIVEREGSRAYKAASRPFVDIRAFAEHFAREAGIRLVFGDTLLRTETIWRYKQGEFVELSPPKFRSLVTAEEKIVDVRRKKEEDEEWRAVSDELLRLVAETKENNEQLFIFTLRRGLASITTCGHCGTVVLCKTCGAPVTLHKGGEGKRNFFLCHKCGEKRSAEEKCQNCDSWKLVPLGVGIERIEEELRAAFPDLKLFKVDKDSTKTAPKAEKEMKTFFQSAGSVLLGTEMALSYFDRKIACGAIATIDSLFSIPDFRINEKILQLMLKLRSLTTRKFLVQTRMPEEKVLEYGISGNLIDFYREEVDERKRFGYPPFALLIKITLEGKKDEVVGEMGKLEEFLKPFEMIAFPALTLGAEGKYMMHALIRLERSEWIDQTLLDKLLSLPPAYTIVVDPETLL